MRKLILIGLLGSSICVQSQKYLDMINRGTYTTNQINESAEKHFDNFGRGKGTGYKQFQRWLYTAQRSVQKDGVLIPYNEQIKSLRSYKKLNRELEKPGFLSTATWQNLGPVAKNGTSGWNPGVGRITSVGIDKGNLNHYIVGGPNCGVWKTTNNGGDWTNLTDGFQDLNVWSLEIDPNNSNKYWWGSSAGYVYTSNDGGLNWTEIYFPGVGTISRIVVHPNNSDVVFICSYFGLYKTSDGGINWTKVQSHTLGLDIEFKPGDPSVVYYSGTKVYKSTDGGDSFSSLNGGFTADETKMMAVSADNPNLIMVLEERSGKFGALYKSPDSGDSFTKIQTGLADVNNMFGYNKKGEDDRGQAPRDMDIIVDPLNDDNIIIAGIQCWKSVDGGDNFNLNTYWTPGGAASSSVGYIHADIDILIWEPGMVFAGTDGGIYTSGNNGYSYDDRTDGISCREFYRIGVSKTDPNVVTGGSQDNGTSLMRGANRDWIDWLGADGMETFVSWDDATKLYGTSQNGSLYRSTNQGISYNWIQEPDGSGSWVTPFEQDPIDASVIYVGFNEVWKSSDNGNNWIQISDFDGNSLDELKIAPTDNNFIYASESSELFITKNGGTSWTDISPGGNINYIHVSPRDKKRIVAVTRDAIYVSTNSGSSWTDYTKNLPNYVSFYCAVWADNNENGLYVGGLGFVSYIEDGMTDYIDFWDGLPMCSVNELEINYISNTIFAATYGRGLWESDLYGAAALDYDVAVSDLTNVPSTLCGSSVNPSVTIENKGSVVITSIKIEVFLNNTLVETINHSTNLNEGNNQEITLSKVIYALTGNNDIKIVVSEPNGIADEKESNNEVKESTFVEFGLTHLFYIDERSANKSLAWSLSNSESQIVKSGSYGSANLVGEQLQEEFCLESDCYDFVVSEAFNSGQCSVAAWSANSVYNGGNQVSFNGYFYEAKWWSQNHQPDLFEGNAGTDYWLLKGVCSQSYNTDVYGLKENGKIEYFEKEVQNYTTPGTNNFCFGSNINVDFSSDVQVTRHCDEVVFTANITGGSPISYNWNFGADAYPATASGEGPHTVKYLNEGIKVVSLTVDGVTETKSSYMVVSLDESKTVTAEIALGNNPNCEGEQIDFTSTVTNEGSNPIYSWLVNGTEQGFLTIFSSDSLSNGDEVSLKVTSDDECSVLKNVTSNLYTVNLTSSVSPSIQIDTLSGESWPLCSGTSITLGASVSNAGSSASITWQVNDISLGAGATYSYSGKNGDVIKAVLNSSLECVTQNNVESNEINSLVDICTSSKSADLVELNAYPNPVMDFLTVEGSGIKRLILTEVSGKVVSLTNVSSIVSKIDLSQLAFGNYLLNIEYYSGLQEVIEIQRK